MLRRWHSWLLLSLALLFTQHGALLHELGHQRDQQQQNTDARQGKSDRAVADICTLCLSLSGLASSLPSPVSGFGLAQLRHVLTERFELGSHQTLALFSLARAPPLNA